MPISLKAAPPGKPRKKRAGAVVYGPEVVAALNVLCRSLRPLLNDFLPAMKAIEKVKAGSHVRKVYVKIPKSPCRRLLESPDLFDAVKAELRQRFKRRNPVPLRKQVHRAVNDFMTVYERKSLPASAHT